MMKWENVCLPKDFGGTGIINTRLFNEALLLKWVWRIYVSKDDDLCCQFLKAKYLKLKPLLSCKGGRGSQFWRGINKIKHKFSWGATFSVNNGALTRFWDDVWLGHTPLRIAFPRLYDLSNNKNGRVCQFYVNGDWNLNFRRTLGHHDLETWGILMDLLEDTHLNNNQDLVTWGMEKSGVYTTKSMYRWLSHRGCLRRVWKSRIPMKLKVFLWQISHDKLQTGVALKKRKWKGSPHCSTCGALESAEHIFFECNIARFIWVSFKEALGWNRAPRGWQDFHDIWLPFGCNDYNTKLFLLAVVLWTLWVSRNKRAIEGKFPRRPVELMFQCMGFLQRWKPLMRDGEQYKLSKWGEQVTQWIEMFQEQLQRRLPADDFM